MSIAPDRISFTGSFVRESFALSRTKSICSVHGRESSNDPKIYNQHSVIKLKHYHDGQVKRFNKSFHNFRYVIISLGGLAVGFMSLLRLNITVAILNMVNQTQVHLSEKPDADLDKYFGEGYEEVGEFNWGNEKQQLIISYYMIAYTLPQLLTTKLAIKIGVRWSIPICIGICAISCLLTPIFAYQGWQYVTILRLVNGLGASAILPMMVHVIELWMPARESALGLAIVQFVQSILFTLSPLVSGLLAAVHWKWAFYIPSIAALIFCLIWLCFVSDMPGDCCIMSQTELDMICGCDEINQKDLEAAKRASKIYTTTTFDKNEQPEVDTSVASWTKALKLKSFYALTGVWIFYCSSFGSFSFLIPSYMRQVLKVPIAENGMLCFIINCGCMISVIWPQPILRFLQSKLSLSLTASRRAVIALICSVTIITWLLIARYHEYQVILFSINRIFHLSTDTIVTSTIMSQYSETGVSSIVYSVINAIGNLSTVLFCMAVGEFLDISGESLECWSWVFVSMCVMNVAILVLFSTVICSEPVKFDDDNNTKSNAHLKEVDGREIKSIIKENINEPQIPSKYLNDYILYVNKPE